MSTVSGQSARARTAELLDPGLTYEEVTGRILAPALRKGFHPLWLIGFAASATLLLVGLISVTWLIVRGVGIWGVNVPVAWGFAIINFVWWIGIGHAGTLISAILLLLRQEWRTSINRFAEAMTLFAVACAGIFPLLHLGRITRFYYLLPYPSTMSIWPQWRSPLVWDVFAVLTYFTVSLLFWYVGLVPDLATMRDRAPRKWVRVIAGVLALGWRGSARHWQRYQTAYLILAGVATPLVVSVHSIVSLDFSTAIVPGWHSTIFPPYFVAGAIYQGFAMVLLIAIPLRAAFGLHDMITARHLDLMAKVMLTSGLIVAYGYLIENFVAWYSGDEFERYIVHNRVAGPYRGYYLATILCNVVAAQALWLRRVRRSPLALMLLGLIISLGMWLERFVIVVVSLHRDFLTSSWGFYSATFWDWTVYLGTIGLFVAALFLFVRLLPTISIFEVRELLHHVRGHHPPPTTAARVEPAGDIEPDEAARNAAVEESGESLYGVMGEYTSPEDVTHAARYCVDAGFTRVEAYTPFPVKGLSEALRQPPTRLPLVAALGAVCGGGGAYFMQWYTAVRDYPLNIGGRPLHSWPSFLPLTFELAVLGAATFMLVAMFLRNGFPQPYHPVFDAEGFERATTDRFFLCIERRDPRFDAEIARRVLRDSGASRIVHVPNWDLGRETQDAPLPAH
jgi:Ni/Fe-hydrogenase subunit HybB-like protein